MAPPGPYTHRKLHARRKDGTAAWAGAALGAKVGRDGDADIWACTECGSALQKNGG
jgi:hypothetical protein